MPGWWIGGGPTLFQLLSHLRVSMNPPLHRPENAARLHRFHVDMTGLNLTEPADAMPKGAYRVPSLHLGRRFSHVSTGFSFEELPANSVVVENVNPKQTNI